MNTPWQLKDYVFAAFMSVGILIAALTQALATAFAWLPGARTLLWAPLAGIFLTLGMARLQQRGAVLVMFGPVALILGLISPIITVVLLVPALITELGMLVFGGYQKPINRFWGNFLYFESSILLSVALTVSGVYTLVGDWFLIPFWPALVGLALGLGAGCSWIGWQLGEKVITQLQKAGKLD